jgi:hypothetical protein
MNFTHAQILELTGMTQERCGIGGVRCQVWMPEPRGGGIVTFEEVVLLAVLSRSMDELGLPVALIASHYEELLITFQENQSIGEPDVVLWLGVDAAVVCHISSPPELEIAAVVRLGPIIERLYAQVHHPGGRQLALSLGATTTP